ncbi:MAG TPA: multiheme c-type cytochrome [Ignavibacteriaceae bacterium]|nr:multiheme c-type cytochrome [Ignavibacteriaceae bacterium]
MPSGIPKTLVIGVVTTVIILLLIYIFTQLPSGGEPGTQQISVNLADKCATCHKRVSPDIVNQFARSTMARSGVKCVDCHVVDKSNPMGEEHEGFFISVSPTPKQCARCHPAENTQFEHSRHSSPAWMALNGFDDFTAEQQKIINENIPEATRGPNGIITATRNSLFDIEGPMVTPLACQSCHSIGKPNADGSIGNCNKCHLRHEFSIEQVRKPEICGQCHLGPDHPQMEIYEESAHGVMYETQGESWNWSQKTGRLTTADMPAPTCATCHMSGFGTQGTTHDVGERLSKFLFAAVSGNRSNFVQGRDAMKSICINCHSPKFVDTLYTKADSVVAYVNIKVNEATGIINGLIKDGIITTEPFATQISFDAFDLWHYYGRTAKFAAYMQGPDYVQWHGIYPLLNRLNKVKEDAERLRREHSGGR